MRILELFVLGLFLISCGGKKPEKESIYKRTKPINEQTATAKTIAPIIDMENIGIGPVENLSFSNKIDQNLVTIGKELFGQKCTACHKTNKRFIGPALAGIYERRNPTWVMNIILNPEEMLKKDPIAAQLLKQYSNTVMFNQNLSLEEARAIVEYFRTL